jgi:hypothetical protein
MLVGEDFKRNGTNEKFETFNNVKLMIEKVKCKIQVDIGDDIDFGFILIYFFFFHAK